MKIIQLSLLFLFFAGICVAQRNTYNIDSYRRVNNDIEFEKKDKVERIRITIAGGPGYMYASSKDAENDLISLGNDRQKVKDYYKKYKLGWQGNADIHYLFNPYMGAGVKYALFSTSEVLKNISFGNYNGDGQHLYFGDIEETLYINYVGPTFLGQTFINRNKTWKVSALISYGYTSYRMEGYVMDFPALITGNAFGGYDEVGIEYFVGRHAAIGFNISTFYSTFKKMKAKSSQGSQTIELSGKERENVSRINGSLSFRIYL